MRPPPLVEPLASLRSRLTDHCSIAARATHLRAAGHGELVIWRYFLESYVVDLDTLSLIMAELFGHGSAGDATPEYLPAEAFGYPEAA
jgi:hypothetical protein